MATKPSPYTPSFLRSAVEGNRPIQLTFSDVKDTNIASTGSFIYERSDAPLKSTQQLNVDWSKFENHTFFMSAEAKVNLAFEQIINGFPFDGSRREVETFFEKLTGYDRYIFDQFPKFHGQLSFTGTKPGETSLSSGTYIVVNDAAGALYPELAKSPTGVSVLNPSNGSSLSIEMQLFIPSISTLGVQTVCQKLNVTNQRTEAIFDSPSVTAGDVGYSLYLMPTSSIDIVEARFSVVSGSFSLTVPATLKKGQFNHICVTLSRETTTPYLQFFIDGESVAISKSRYAFDDMKIDSSAFIIASGTRCILGTTVITPTQTMSGTIDEFRVFHSIRTSEQQKSFAAKPIFATPELKLYYKFNEPPPPLTTLTSDSANSIVIDSSGNALHSNIVNFFSYSGTLLRQDASADPLSKVIFEKEETVPVLFPAHPDIISLNTELLTSASLYDQSNPNLITRLIPQHYLLEGTLFDGFSEPEGQGGDPYSGTGIPGQGKLGNVQLMLSMLYIWARFFDEMKLYVDAFSSLTTVDYDTNTSMPNNFLRSLIEQYGFHLPGLFDSATIEQYTLAENIDPEISTSETPLKHVQNELMRRILINLPNVLRSKGTQHSIKAFLRAVGIDPENSLRLREYGGPTTQQLSFSRETKRDVATMVRFVTSSLAISPYLSASRYEPGFPITKGSFVQQKLYPPNGISNFVDDGLLTSGSWTVETIVRYTPVDTKAMTSTTQSLLRLCVASVSSPEDKNPLLATNHYPVFNVLAISSSISPKLIMYARPGYSSSSTSSLLTMSVDMPNPGIFDGNHWNVSFGVERNDTIDSRVSSSYFLRIARQDNGDIDYYKTKTAFFEEARAGVSGEINILRNSIFNTVKSFIAIGENQPKITSSISPSGSFLNQTSVVPSEARVTAFTGLQSNLRFWSKALTETEWREHIRNYKSTGVEDPSVHYNYVTNASGSFEKLRLNSLVKQETRTATGTSGSITFIDASENGFHLTGSGYPIDTTNVIGDIFIYSYLSPHFDEAVSDEKIRIRSFSNQDLVDVTPWAGVAPVYEIVKSERPTDDVRFSIDFSLIDTLNRDIVTLFSTFDAIDNVLGSPELIFSPDYPDLEKLRNVYFNRIKEKLNFKAFIDFYRWFDTSIGTFIKQLIPRKTNFKGTNFIIESHMLERHKLEYFSNEIYLGEADRNRIKDVLLLQLISGIIRKY